MPRTVIPLSQAYVCVLATSNVSTVKKNNKQFKIKCFPLGSQWNASIVQALEAHKRTHIVLCEKERKKRTEYCSVEKCYSKYDYLKTEQPEFESYKKALQDVISITRSHWGIRELWGVFGAEGEEVDGWRPVAMTQPVGCRTNCVCVCMSRWNVSTVVFSLFWPSYWCRTLKVEREGKKAAFQNYSKHQ